MYPLPYISISFANESLPTLSGLISSRVRPALFSPGFAADDLIEIKQRGVVPIKLVGSNAARGPVTRHGPDQKLRRLLLPSAGSRRAGAVWKLAQINTPAKITKTETTAAETKIESTGIATSC